MYDHLGLKVRDVAASADFYHAVLTTLGHVPGGRDATSASFTSADGPALYLSQGPVAGTGAHIAFRAATPDQVHRFHAAGLAAGGRDNGAPGPRPDYGSSYYAAFLIDPDGNNVEAMLP